MGLSISNSTELEKILIESTYGFRDLVTVDEMKGTFTLLKELGYNHNLDTYIYYLEDMVSKGYRQLAIVENNEYIAMSGYWFSTKLFCGPYVELDNFVVTESHRSKGIGKILCRMIEEKAIQYGCKTAVLDAYVYNERSHQFYFREGYIIRGFHFLKALD